MNQFIAQARDQLRDQADHVLDNIAQRLPMDLTGVGMEAAEPVEAAEPFGERAAQISMDVAIAGIYRLAGARHLGHTLLMSTLGAVEAHHNRHLHQAA